MSAAQDAFIGSQAYNRTSDVSETIIPNTGSLLLTLPLFQYSGIREGIGLDLKLTYAMGTPGRLGLPAGWTFGVPYLSPGDAINIKGQRFIIDPNWSDATGYKSGLKYENNHGVSFVDHVTVQPLPHGATGDYQFSYVENRGDSYYFDGSGKLLMKADVYGNFLLYAYTSNGLVDRITDSYGQVTSFGYNPNQILIKATDGRVCTLNYSAHGIDSYTNPLGEATAFTYALNNNLDVIVGIDYPTGKTSLFTYTGIRFLDANRTPLSIPAISDLYYKDNSGAILAHYQYAYGTQSGGNTFTGATQGYVLSAQNDGLLDSDNTAYQYNVERRILDGSGKIIALRNTYYNFSHVALSDDSYVIDPNGAQQGYHQTVSTYQITPNQHNRQPNYLSPKTSQSGFVAQGTTKPVPKTQSAFEYDAYGNLTSEELSVFDEAASAFVQTQTLSTSYFTGSTMPLQTLTDTTTRTDHVTNTAIRRTNILTSDRRAIAGTAISSQDASGNWADWKERQRRYDSNGRVTSETLKWTRSGAPGIAQTTTSYAYSYDNTALAVATAITNALGNVSHVTTSTMTGQTISETRPSGATTSYTYDALGRLTATTSPSGKKRTQSYKVFSKDGENSTTVTTPMGYARTKEFDALNRLIEESDNGNPTAPGQERSLSKKVYDMLGNVVRETDRYGNDTICTYQSTGKPVQSEDPLGNIKTIAYDYASNTTRTSLNGILQKTVVLDNAGNTLTEELAPNTANPDPSTQYSLRRLSTYDGSGHRLTKTVSSIDSSGNATPISSESYTYDPEDNLIKTDFSAPDGSRSEKSTVYDLLNKETTHSRNVTMSDGSHYTVPGDVNCYDEVGRKTKVTNALGQSETFTYTVDGQVESRTSLGGEVMTCSYGPDGERTAEAWNDQAATKTTFGYDDDGRRITVSDASGTVKTSYSIDGVVTQIVYPDGKTVTDTLDGYSRKVTRTDATGVTTNYTYTALNQLDTVTTAGDSLSYSYYKDTSKNLSFGAVESVALAGRYSETYLYDAHNRRNQTTKTAPNGTNFLTENTVTNTSGKIEQTTLASGLSTSDKNLNRKTVFTYDGFNQLTGTAATDSQGNVLSSEKFVYDGNGNAVTRDQDGTTTKYSYNAINQLIQYAKGGGPVLTQSYDANGRLTRDGSQRQYTYDVQGRLLGIGGSVKTGFSYYANGLMQQRSSAGGKSKFYYDSNQQVVTTDDGSKPTGFLLVGSRRYASYTGSADGYYFGTTFQQSTIMGLTKAGAIVGSASYLAYGVAQDDTLKMTAANSFAWKQEYRDPDQGLVYLRARFYDPATMRFLTMDSQPYDNRYAFGNADPINNMDPTGHDALDYVGLGLGLTVGVAAVAAVTYVAVVYGPAIMAFLSAASALAGGAASVGGVAAGGIAAGAMAALGLGGGGGAAIAGVVTGATTAAAGGGYGAIIGGGLGSALGSLAADGMGLGVTGTMVTTSIGGYVGAMLGTAAEPIVGSAVTTLTGAVTGAITTATETVSGVASGVLAGATTAAETATATVGAVAEMATAGATAAVEAATAAAGAVAASFEAGDLIALAALGFLAFL